MIKNNLGLELKNKKTFLRAVAKGISSKRSSMIGISFDSLGISGKGEEKDGNIRAKNALKTPSGASRVRKSLFSSVFSALSHPKDQKMEKNLALDYHKKKQKGKENAQNDSDIRFYCIQESE